MSDSYGLPSYGREDTQFDKEIFAAYSPPPRLDGGTILAASGDLASGTVLARITASGKYVPYDGADVSGDGTATAVAILRSHVDATHATKDALGELVFAGVLKHDQLVGLDAGAVTDLGGRVDEVRNEFVFGYGG